jgi:hypothetical protein
MTRGANSFRQRDLARAIRGARAAGLTVDRVLVDPKTGKIEVVTGPATGKDSPNGNEWDTLPADGAGQ